jgi:uncharacterized damage-inducible protein DinB
MRFDACFGGSTWNRTGRGADVFALRNKQIHWIEPIRGWFNASETDVILARGFSMTLREYLQQRWAKERPAFQRVLHALPTAKFAYSPHERSPSAAQIVWTLALEAKVCSELMDEGQSNWEPGPLPTDPDTIVAAWHRHTADLGERISGLDEAAWHRSARFLVHGNLAWEAPLGELLWHMFFDSIHHRGQLSTYIRPMGGTVPSIYGPSGDSPSA